MSTHHLEAAYRRGYHHAVAEALRAFVAGLSAEEVAEWTERVAAWRADPSADDTPPLPRYGGRRAETRSRPVAVAVTWIDNSVAHLTGSPWRTACGLVVPAMPEGERDLLDWYDDDHIVRGPLGCPECKRRLPAPQRLHGT